MLAEKYHESFDSQKSWLPFALVGGSTILAIIISIISLSFNHSIIFQNIFYFPIILSCVFYLKRGLIFSFFIAIIYFFLVFAFNQQPEILIGVFIRFVVFVLIAVVVYFLSYMRLQSSLLLEQSCTEYHSLVSNLAGVLYRYELNSEKNLVYISNHIEYLTGYKASEYSGNAGVVYESFIHPDDIDIYNQAMSDSISSNVPLEIDYRIYHKDGSLKWVHEKGNILKDKIHEKTYLDGVIVDITHTKQDEEDKRIEAMDASLDGIAVLNEKEQFVYANAAFVAAYRYESSNELIGSKWRILYDDDEIYRFESSILPLLNRSGRWRGEARGKKKDGTLFSQEISLSVTKNGGIICVVRDITQRLERQRQEKEMIIAKKTLVFKHNFLANMSHEMRTPLTGILGMTDVLEKTIIDPVQRECIKDLQDSATILKDMVDQVLDFSRIEQGEISLNIRSFNLIKMLDNIKSIYKHTCEGKSVELQIIKDKLLPTYIKADKSRIARVLNILMSNAIKFTHEGTIAVKARVYDSIEENNQIILLFEVSDTGIGIDEENQQNVFEPFKSMHESDTRAYDGSGLGLPIAKELVALHGGEIGLISTIDEGSTFWFTIVAQRVEELSSN
jgi:PAS domain S-box-containing protein